MTRREYEMVKSFMRLMAGWCYSLGFDCGVQAQKVIAKGGHVIHPDILECAEAHAQTLFEAGGLKVDE